MLLLTLLVLMCPAAPILVMFYLNSGCTENELWLPKRSLKKNSRSKTC